MRTFSSFGLMLAAIAMFSTPSSAQKMGAKPTLEQARRECWTQYGYPNGPDARTLMRAMEGPVTACVKKKLGR